jgi:hypothetical protein
LPDQGTEIDAAVFGETTPMIPDGVTPNRLEGVVSR